MSLQPGARYIERTDAGAPGPEQQADATASPLRHRSAPPDSVHPLVLGQLGFNGAANAGGTVDLPPVTVTADVVGGHFIQDYSAFLEAFSAAPPDINQQERSEEHTSELKSLMRNSYAGLCLNKKKK